MPVPPAPPSLTFRMPSWFRPYTRMPDRRTMRPETHVLFWTTSRIMPFLDPETQRSTARWLATQDPRLFGHYMTEPWRAAGDRDIREYDPLRYLTRERLEQTIQALVPERGRYDNPDIGPLAWLRGYLRAAQTGMPAWGGGLPTSRERYDALLRLRTLEDEARNNPALQPYLTLAKNLVSPLLDRAPRYLGVGFERTIVPPFGGTSPRYQPRPSPWFI